MDKTLHRTFIFLLLVIGLLAAEDSYAQRNRKKKKKNKQSKELIEQQKATEENIVISAGYEEDSVLVNLSDHAELKTKLNTYFSDISSIRAIDIVNEKIIEVKDLFVSEDVPVLISLGNDDSGSPIYDKPMTLSEFLNYLKFRKEYRQKIKKLTVNKNGEISKMVLEY